MDMFSTDANFFPIFQFVVCSSSFFVVVAVIKYPEPSHPQKQLKGDRVCFSSQFQVTIHYHGQKLETAGYITPAGRSREMTRLFTCSIVLSLILPLLWVRTLCLGNGAAHSGLCLPTSINLIRQPSTDISRPTQRRQVFIETLFPGDSRLRHGQLKLTITLFVESSKVEPSDMKGHLC